jgi:redox-sensing transcriptional repressor
VANQVPDIVVGRLPLYLRALINLEAQGQLITSSKELSQILDSSAAQIRKDLSHFGEFGKQGTGYHIKHLINQLRQILHADQDWNVVLVGAGDLGHALLRNQGIARRGYRIVAAFDISHERIGSRVGNVIIQNSDRLQEEIEQLGLKLAIIAVPTPAAQQVADSLVKAGVKAILNYSPIALRTPSDVQVQYIDPVAQMQHMTYYLLEIGD